MEEHSTRELKGRWIETIRARFASVKITLLDKTPIVRHPILERGDHMGIKRKVKRRELTPKQKKFIAFYTGNGADAARKAGYAGDDNTLKSVAYENLTKPYIRQAIQKRHDIEIEPLIASRLDRQKFWAEVLRSKKVPMKDRLKASELLGKSEADFTDVVKQQGSVVEKVIVVSEAEVEQALEKFNKEY